MADAIKTVFIANAPAMRGVDWAAYRDPESRMVGYGATEVEALDDLLRLERAVELTNQLLKQA